MRNRLHPEYPIPRQPEDGVPVGESRTIIVKGKHGTLRIVPIQTPDLGTSIDQPPVQTGRVHLNNDRRKQFRRGLTI